MGIFPESCSSEGVIDLAGNVWEWCWDWFNKEYYEACTKEGVSQDPRGLQSGEYRVIRGGAYVDNPGILRCTDRGWRRPQIRHFSVGFRIVSDL